ncbi:TolC family protein [Rufibacter roseolus]|uniref:TolC family protein n=1 Tax=Rufibacter roseolus TaxID=2817375 RepID=UPI001B30748B|nr:TolC family protein [Rufibacter roseolus]
MRRFSSKFLASLGLVIGCHTFLVAQTTTPTETVWSLQQCIQAGLQNNLQVKQTGLFVEQDAIDVRQAMANFLPAFNASASHGMSFGFFNDPITYEQRNESNRSSSFSLQASVPVFSGLQVQNTVKRNRLNLKATELELKKAQNDLMLNIVTSYMNILLNQELLKTNQERYNLTKAQAERTQKLFKAGSVPESNVLELNAQLASDELNIITAQNQIEISELQLIQLLNLENTAPANFAIEIPQLPDPDQSVIAFDAQQVYETAESIMPEIRSNQLRVESALKTIDIAKGAYFPTLSLGGSVSTRYSSGTPFFLVGPLETVTQTIGVVQGTNTPVITTYSDRTRTPTKYKYMDQLQDNLGQYVGLNLSIPILNSFRTRNNVQLSRIGLRNAELNTAIARNQLRQNIAQAYTNAINAQKRFVSARKQLESFEQSFKNAEIRLNNGLINSVDFNVARNNYVKAQSDIIQAKYDYIFRLKFLEFYQGKTITL